MAGGTGGPTTSRKQVARALALSLTACLALALPAARACGLHDARGLGLGMLNLAYPDALHVRTAVWMAQRDGGIDRVEPTGPPDLASPAGRLEAIRRYTVTVLMLGELRDRLPQRTARPSFAVVLIGPMLWTRFQPTGAGLEMTAHVTGPAPDDVVVVTDAPVLAALVDGRLTAAQARERGLLRIYGTPERERGIAALLDGLSPRLGAATPALPPA